ncbi:MAG TPA: DPP IV N-terminal domain-containing protein [Candidatus Limnocylindria bacterium]|nr:DPP IV N-terminal domain-containing protein [Candidatus Limnocylindria bacterium]
MARRLTLDDISHLPYPGTAVPASIQFSPDGDALTYLYSEEGTLVRSLWWHDLRSNERRVIAEPVPDTQDEASLSLEEHLRRERTRTSELGVTDYAWAPQAARSTILVPLDGQLLISRDGDRAQALPGIDGAFAAAIAPDGSRVAYVVDGDVWIAELDGTQRRRVTDDAEPGVFNGLADYAAAEELDRFDGMWWSHDGSALAYAHVDERNVPPFMIAHLGAERPEHEEHRYPFAGGPNAHVSLRVIAAGATDGGTEVPLGIGDGYLARVVAEPAGGWLVAVLPRDQRSLRWIRVTPSGAPQELWVETASPWINLDVDTRVLADGRILRSTERSGYRHLELRDADGHQGPTLTAGEWMVTQVVHVDEKRSEVLFIGTADGSVERHLYAAPLDPAAPVAKPERLTVEEGWHGAVASPAGSRWVDTWSTNENSPQVVLRHRGREPSIVLHHASENAESMGIRAPALFRLAAGDGSSVLDAALYRPAEPVATPPPCVVWVYGGPHLQYVTRSWFVSQEGLHHYLAQCGVAVLVVDNRGAANRGLAFEGAIAGHLGSVEVADQAAAVRQLAEAGEIDASRVVITGTSYGGFMTLMCLIQRPDLFTAGVAVAPVTDQAGYDTAYTERYLGNPNADPEAYRRSSPLPRAAELPESLLLIHGAIDENVHLRHSVRLVAALQAVGRQVELVLLPEDRHRPRTAEGLRMRDGRTVTHLLTSLGVPLPAELRGGSGTATASAG